MKTMKQTLYIMIGMAALLTMPTSCVKDDLYDTPHSDTGKITVTADWTLRGELVAVPASWNIAIGDYTGTETGATHAPDHLFAPGSYTLVAYSPADGIAVSGTTATVSTASGNWDGVGSFIAGTPGWLFSCVQQVIIEADTDYALTAVMRQQVRELTLVIEPTGDAADRIESIEGYLSGAAGSMDFATDTHGNASNVELHFTKIADGTDAGKWSTTVRLLGIGGNMQKLIATITYAGGNPADTRLDSDLTAALDGFNDDKTVPLTLGGTVIETPNEAGFTAAITDWQPGNGSGEDADIK